MNEDFEKSGIYQIVNSLNEKRYIGSAKCFRVRWNQHRMRLRRGNHHARHLQYAWNKYGEDAFQFRIMEFCDVAQLLIKEQSALDALMPEYNTCRTAGNSTGVVMSDETKGKIRQRAIGRKMPERSAEYREKLSKISLGKPKPPHVLAALQAGRARQVFTEDRRKKVSEALVKAYETGERKREKTEVHKNRIGKFFAKLTDDQIREIRRLRASGALVREVAAAFKMPGSTVSQIVKGKRYRWVA